MQNAILLLLGGFMGLVVFTGPLLFGLTKGEQLDKESFKDAFPKKIVVYYLYTLFPLIWLFLYFAIIPIVAQYAVSVTYFSGYLFLGGFGVLDGLLEVVTGISPIRGGRGSLRLRHLVVNDSVRRLGIIRLSLFWGIGLLSWVIIFLVV
jgi:hypothetical protein